MHQYIASDEKFKRQPRYKTQECFSPTTQLLIKLTYHLHMNNI